MSLKSLGLATLGLLKRGLKQTLHIATLGYLRSDDEIKKPELPDNLFVQPGIMLTKKIPQAVDYTNDNNIILLLALDSVI